MDGAPKCCDSRSRARKTEAHGVRNLVVLMTCTKVVTANFLEEVGLEMERAG